MANEAERLLERITEARGRIRACGGATLYSELSAVARTYRLFSANERELGGYFARFTETQALLELWDTNHRERFDSHLDEIDRLLHNYLAAAASLRDHSRCLWQKHPPQDASLTAEHDRRIKATFADSPVANFVQKLRNFTLHAHLPVIHGTMSWSADEGTLTSATVLSKGALTEWDGWNAQARVFLAQSDDEIDLLEVVGAYTAAVHDFNRWFGRSFVEGHLAAFDELSALQAAYAALLPQAPE